MGGRGGGTCKNFHKRLFRWTRLRAEGRDMGGMEEEREGEGEKEREKGGREGGERERDVRHSKRNICQISLL